MPHPAYLAYRGAAALAQALPASVAEPTARALGRAAAVAMPGRRRLIEKNLGRATDGHLQGEELRRASGEAFASYGRYWLELFRLPIDVRDPASVEARFEAEGFDFITDGLEAGTASSSLPHLGGFDSPRPGSRDGGSLPRWWSRHSNRRSCSSGSCGHVAGRSGMEVIPLGPKAAPAVCSVR